MRNHISYKLYVWDSHTGRRLGEMERSQAAFVSQVHLDHILVGADDDGKDDSENDFDEADGDDDGKDGGRSDDDFDGDEVKSYFDSRLLEEQANKFDCFLLIKILPEQLR